MQGIPPTSLAPVTARPRPNPPRRPPEPAGEPCLPKFSELRSELSQRLTTLNQLVRQACPETSAEVAAHLGTLEELEAQFESTNSVAIKASIRQTLYGLRKALSAGPASGHSKPIRAALEKARNVALDNSWEKSLKGIPSRHHCVVAPPLGEVANFDQVEPGLYRGGQPTSQGVDWLLAHGIDHEVDLRGSDADNQWLPTSWKNMQRHSIPVADFEAPTFAQVEEFVKLIDDPANRPVFVHCKAGVGRTGVMIACWRVARGATAEEAIDQERINSYHGTLAQEDFVREFEKFWLARQP
ncbi:MAG: dual specificity protein phosphatase family protein [Candidatus Eremiobacteraeota bacterium]|nr:dual specificity protein phosphatase family protein [Candidatus Eremiobacteraeota bacterium]